MHEEPSDSPPDGRSEPPPEGRIRDRHVLLVATAVVALVLGLRLAGELVPGIDQFLGAAPLLIIALVVITTFVLLRALRPARD